MSWWSDALYDTCSLITLDKILLDHVEIAAHFPSILALEKSLSGDQMREDTATRVRGRANIQDLPTVSELATILAAANLPKSLADADQLIYATAVHHKLRVVTGDKGLAKKLRQAKCRVGNVALVLQELVVTKAIAEGACETILNDLVVRSDIILGKEPPTWKSLQKHTFP